MRDRNGELPVRFGRGNIELRYANQTYALRLRHTEDT